MREICVIVKFCLFMTSGSLFRGNFLACQGHHRFVKWHSAQQQTISRSASYSGIGLHNSIG